jgi:hypothetical protein
VSAGIESYGIEPFFPCQARFVLKHDYVLVATGKATATMELVQETGPDPMKDGNVLIRLYSQQTISVPHRFQIVIARRGENST